MRINPKHRKKVVNYLRKFYSYYPKEKYTVFHFVRYFKKRLKNNKDAWLAVSGATGTGKSYFVLMSMILTGRPMTLTDNVCYIPKGSEIRDKFKKLKFNTLLIDEAAKEMRGVNWHSKAQQEVNVDAMTERYLNNMVYLNIPNFRELTKPMREGSILFRVIIPYRTRTHARVIVQMKSRNFRSDDPWNDKAANKIYEKMEKRRIEITNEKMLDIERGLPNTIMDFMVPNLELILPEVTDEYKRLKIESRGEVEELNKPRDIYKEKYTQTLQKISKMLYNNEFNGEKKVTKADISRALDITPTTLNKYLNAK